MDVESIKESEYDAHLFGFTVEDFIAAFTGLYKAEVTRLTSSMGSSFIKNYPDGDPEIDLIKDTMTTLVNQYMSSAEEPLNTLKAQLKELMRVPPHVLLPEDAAQRTQYSAEEEKELDKQVEDLLQRLKRAKAFKAELQQELKMLEDVVPDLSKRVEELEKAVAAQRKSEDDVEKLELAIDKTARNTEELLQLHELENDQQ